MRSLSRISLQIHEFISTHKMKLSQQAVDKYFELKQERAQEENTSDVTQPIKNVAETEENK